MPLRENKTEGERTFRITPFMKLAVELVQLLGVPIAAGVIGAFMANVFSAHYGFKRFRKEQWWQLKRAAYESIIGILTDIMLTAQREMEREETGGTSVTRKPPPRTNQPSLSLQEIVAAGSYIVSEKTVEAVRPVLSRLVDNEEVEHDQVRLQLLGLLYGFSPIGCLTAHFPAIFPFKHFPQCFPNNRAVIDDEYALRHVKPLRGRQDRSSSYSAEHSDSSIP
jgi:hypothetical protein